MKKEIIIPENVAKPPAPYASAIKIPATGNLVFVSGVVGTDMRGEIVCKGDVLGQAKDAFQQTDRYSCRRRQSGWFRTGWHPSQSMSRLPRWV
jgi:enamine deaminase RidA (YjgF/YER057c/UK114 family)